MNNFNKFGVLKCEQLDGIAERITVVYTSIQILR